MSATGATDGERERAVEDAADGGPAGAEAAAPIARETVAMPDGRVLRLYTLRVRAQGEAAA